MEAQTPLADNTADKTASVPARSKYGPRKAVDVPKNRRMTPLVVELLDLLASGQARTQKEAAKLVGCSPEYVSRQLAKDHVKDYLRRKEEDKTRGTITGLRAANVFAGLLDAESDKVRLEVADRILTARGTLPSAKGSQTTNVNVGVSVGYVIDLTEPKVIDVTP